MMLDRNVHVHRDPDASGRRPPLIGSNGESCHECWSCARVCPAKAIKITDGRPEIIYERCVSCGACVMECSSAGYLVRDDTDAVRLLLSGGRPVVAVLATEFITALHPLIPMEVERRLESLGFYAVESTLLGEEIVAKSYEEFCARGNGLPLIRSTCPVVVEWVRRYHPSLTAALAPIIPPYIAQARLVKELYPGDVAVVYAGPCFARKDEALDSQFGGAVDVAIDFIELSRLLREAVTDDVGVGRGMNRPVQLKEISLIDGFPRVPLEQRSMISTDVHVSRNLCDVDRVLGAIENGETAPDIVDLLSCEGCIDGPAVDSSMSVFAKRNIDIADRESRGASGISSRDLLRYLPDVDLVRTIKPDPVIYETPSDEQIDAILAQEGFKDRSETIDCGTCGYQTCVEMAVATHQGTASWEMCFPLRHRRLARDIEVLTASATIDPGTGLCNKGALMERLEDEISRFRRYGSPVSLLMLDLDSFKRVNDEHGHLVGDQLLSAVGHLLADGVRASDFPSRYGGDEFAIILPGTSKTEAYAVAEKMRMSIASLEIMPRGGNGETSVNPTASIGVGSVGGGIEDSVALLEAADRALYAAKKGGRDQVRLASQ